MLGCFALFLYPKNGAPPKIRNEKDPKGSRKMSTTQQEQTRAAAPQEYLLEMRGITKAFAGVQALKGVDFYVRPGTVHALMGENGAGKSTLMKCLFGIYHKDEGIREQNGLEEERYLYRNTVDDGNVLVDYGFEGLTCTNTFEYENGISKSFGNYALNTAPDAENLFFGNVYGASEHFWSDMMIYDGETDPNVLKQKMLTGEYVIIGNRLDRLSGGPKTTSLSEQLQIGDSISFYRDGELVKTCTILAKACTVGTEDETPTTTTATMHIGGDAPFVYLPDTVFKQIYTTPTLLNYGFNMDASLHPQMEDFLSSYVEKNPSVTYTSTKLLKEQLNSVASMVWVVGSLIGCIMALAGLINFTNMIITNIITRRHEFATMQSIGMTNRQLQRLMVYEGVYYAAGADIIGGVVALLLAVTVLKNVLNSPSMWFFTLHITLVPALVIGVLYLLLAAVIPLIVLHFFNKGTVVERLRTSE